MPNFPTFAPDCEKMKSHAGPSVEGLEFDGSEFRDLGLCWGFRVESFSTG